MVRIAVKVAIDLMHITLYSYEAEHNNAMYMYSVVQ